MRRNLFLTVFAVVLLTFVCLPSLQAISADQLDPIAKRQAMQLKMDEMRAEIKANGYDYEVGFNPAMQYDISQLCNFNPDLQPEFTYAVEPTNISRAASLPVAYEGYATPIKNQGSCGSCWAFSTIGVFEGAIKMVDGVTVDLSEQELVSCNTEGWGCNGGWFANDMIVNPGAALESCFPYVASDVPCQSCPHPYAISSWGYCGTSSAIAPVDSIKQAILDYGSVSAACYVDSAYQAYVSGVFTNVIRNKRKVNHAVVIVGWDDTLGASGAWKMKNSWGTGWGENGYMWVSYGSANLGYGANYVIY